MAGLSSWPACAPQTWGRKLTEKNGSRHQDAGAFHRVTRLQQEQRKMKPLHACWLPDAMLPQEENNARDLQSCCDE